MTTRKIREAEAAVAAAELALSQARLKLARAENAAPPEPTAEGTTLRFKVQYRAGEKSYTYVTLKTDKGWLLTGLRNSGRHLTWDEIVAVADKNYFGRAHFEDIT